MNQNLGVLIEEVGANPKDWTPYQPIGENQFTNNADFMACVSYSFCHVLETLIKYHTGQTVDLAERFLAKVAADLLISQGGDPHKGNTWVNVYKSALSYGIPLQSDWDVPPNATWDQFYADIPQEVKDKAKKFLDQWTISGKQISSMDVASALETGPLQIFIELGHPYHAQELVNLTTVFDSYGPPFNKPVKSVNNYFQILLTPKMGQLVTGNGKTVWYLFNGFRFWILDPQTLTNGTSKLWSGGPVQIDETALMAMPYGGGLFLSQTDSPNA